MSDDHHDNERKAAIALNNAAVCLLRRCYYEEAIATLKDGMGLTKAATHQGTTRDEQDHRSPIEAAAKSKETVRLVLDRAWKRAAACNKAASPEDLSAAHLLQDISSRSDPASTFLACGLGSKHSVLPMTIDPIDCASCSSRNLGFLSSILLYNFGIGISCARLAAAADDDVWGTAELLQKQSFRALHLSRGIVSQLTWDEWGSDSSYMMFGLLLTHSLMQVSAEMGLRLEFEEQCKNMASLLRLVEAELLVLPMFLAQSRAAPAA